MKYLINRSDGMPIDPESCFFILRLDSDEDARKIARGYPNEDLQACLDGLEGGDPVAVWRYGEPQGAWAMVVELQDRVKGLEKDKGKLVADVDALEKTVVYAKGRAEERLAKAKAETQAVRDDLAAEQEKRRLELEKRKEMSDDLQRADNMIKGLQATIGELKHENLFIERVEAAMRQNSYTAIRYQTKRFYVAGRTIKGVFFDGHFDSLRAAMKRFLS